VETISAGEAIGHPNLGRFCFPPESHRPEETYSAFAKLQGAANRKSRMADLTDVLANHFKPVSAF
jgi:hypothetical protein